MFGSSFVNWHDFRDFPVVWKYIPSDNDLLNMIVKWFAIIGAATFTSLADILSGPVALFVD